MITLNDIMMSFDLKDHAQKLAEQFGQGIDPGRQVPQVQPIQRPVAMKPNIDPGRIVGGAAKTPPPQGPGGLVGSGAFSIEPGREWRLPVGGLNPSGPGTVNNPNPLMRSARNKARGK